MFSAGPESLGGRPVRPETYLFFAALFGAIVFLSHAAYLDLPFYWDEAGQFVPQTLDLLREGRWIPVHTQPNVHPPGIIAYLASVWSLTGVSIEVARLAMLLLATFGVLGSFLLAIELSGTTPGAPGFVAVVFLLVSPLFFTQAMLVQLDMPAMVFTTWGLFLFLRSRFALCVAACCVLVLVKETGVVLPLCCGAFLLYSGQRQQALRFAIPVLPLAAWLIYLHSQTGQWLGHSEFAQYNLWYALHPVRIGASLLRRASFLFIENFQMLGAVAIAVAAYQGRFRGPSWRFAGLFVLCHVVIVSALGGASLERYLLPIMPVMYAAVSMGFHAMPEMARILGVLVMTSGLAASLFWNPPLWPFPFENNLAMVDFVRLHQQTAKFLETNTRGQTVTTAWPLSIELSRPDLGYVTEPLPVRELAGFNLSDVLKLHAPSAIFVLYSREWDPPHNLFHWPSWRRFRQERFGYEDPITGADLERRLGMRRIRRWEERGQWIEVWAP